MDKSTGLPLLYNGLLETAARGAIILETFFPERFSLEEVRLLDFFAVFGGDLGGPTFLHPPIEGRGLAFGVREAAVVASLDFLDGIGQVEKVDDKWTADGNGTSLEGMLSHPYHQGLFAAGEYFREMMSELGKDQFFSKLRNRLGELTAEDLRIPDSQDERFRNLADIYACDLLRCGAIVEAASLFSTFAKEGKPDRSIPGPSWFGEVALAAAEEHRRITLLSAGLRDLAAVSVN